MKNSLPLQAAQIYQDRRRKKLWHRIVSGMVCVVVFCTVYALILPAITLEKEPVCGREEHTHTEACYITETVEPTTEYLCAEELAGSVTVHTHDESCYEEERTLSCTEEHEHSDDCYEVSRELACGQEENEGHIHGPECYGTEDVLVCGLSEEPHVHTDDCYAYVPPHIIKSLRESGKTTNISSNRKGRAHSQAQTVIQTGAGSKWF